jgi:membrane protein DedA with SNARE-associated domain
MLTFVQQHSYFLIFLVMIIEGPIITTAAASAASLGYFDIWIIFFLSLAGDLIGDFLHYAIGLTTRLTLIENFGHYFGLKKSTLKKIEKHMKNNFGKTFFLIKFTPPLTSVGLISSGALRIPILKFILFSLVITLPRTIFFTILGYSFGSIAEKILTFFNLGQYAVIFLTVLLVFSYFAFKKIYRLVARSIQLH